MFDDAREPDGGQPHISELTTLPAYRQLGESDQKEAYGYAARKGFLMEALYEDDKPKSNLTERRQGVEFTEYDFYKSGGSHGRPRIEVVEHLTKTDDSGHGEDRSGPAYGFNLPGGMFRLMRENDEYRIKAGHELTAVRKEIEAAGGVNFVIEWSGDQTVMTPIWEYRLNGEDYDDEFDVRDLPLEVLEAIKENGRNFRQDPRYRRWYGRAMMDKRNEILADELVRRMGYEEPKRAEAGTGEPAAPIIGDTDLSAAREVTLEGTVPGEFRVTGKEDAAESKTASASAVEAEPAAPAEKKTAAAEPTPAPKHDTPARGEKLLWEKFGSADKVAGLAEIRAGVAEIAARFTHLVRTPEDLKGVLDIAMVMAVDGLKTQAEKAGRTYDVRNDEVVRLLLQQQLESKSGVLAPKEADAPARKATVPKPTPVAAPDESAAELPPEILTEDEARFFAASPALSGVTGVRVSVRGEGKNPRSMVSVGLEKGRENEGVERLVRAAVSDAMDGMPDPLFKIGSAVSDFLVSYVTGDERETPAGKRLRAEVVDVERGEAVIRDYRRLVEVVKKVAAEMKV